MADEATNEPTLANIQYRVVNTLGEGAGSTILLIADKTRGGKRFALKVVRRLDEDDDIYIKQAQTEYEVSQKLKHPAIVRIYDCKLKKSWFKVSGVELLMEYLEGKTLDKVDSVEPGQLVLMFDSIASAFVLMHRRGVYHGDLKPSNIMLTKDGQVKLIDFGTAWLRGQSKERIQGTPQYMAPEQVTERTVNEKTDIYTFGATLYKLLTGRFANQGIPKAGEQATKNKVPPPSQLNPKIPGKLSELVMQCLEVSPDKRPEGMHAVKAKLEDIAKYMGLKEGDLKGAVMDES